MILKAQTWRAVYVLVVLVSLQTLWAAPPSLQGINPLHDGLAVADFDGDSTPDIANSQTSGRTELRGTSTYVLRVQLSAPASANAGLNIDGPSGGLDLWTADIDADQDADIIVTARASGSRIGVLVNDGSGRFDRQLQPEPAQPVQTKIGLYRSGRVHSAIPAILTFDALTVIPSVAKISVCYEDLRGFEDLWSRFLLLPYAHGRAPPLALR